MGDLGLSVVIFPGQPTGYLATDHPLYSVSYSQPSQSIIEVCLGSDVVFLLLLSIKFLFIRAYETSM